MLCESVCIFPLFSEQRCKMDIKVSFTDMKVMLRNQEAK